MKDRISGQLNLAEQWVGRKLGGNERLERISGLVKWYRFERLLGRLRSAPEGRPPYPALAMFKALLLQQWYRLSDVELEEALLDRLSFRRFVGVGLDESVPDSTTLCRFRNDLAAAGLAERLFTEMNRQLEKQGLILKSGTLIDATLVEAAVRPSGSAAAPSDPDAAFARRAGSAGSTFGYKAHLAVDQSSGLVREALLTGANVNETTVADALIQGDEQAIYADKAYGTHARSALLKRLGIKDRIQRRGNKHHALRQREKHRNKLIGMIRGRIETTFAVLKVRYGWQRMRYVGSTKNLSHLHLLCIAMNLRRALVLTA